MADDNDPLELQLRVWEKTIEVQEHFNDIALRVRNLFVTLLAAVLAVLGYGIKSGPPDAGAAAPDLSTMLGPYVSKITFLGCIICFAFWFLDRWWYHRLLQGAVLMGSDLEERLKPRLGDIGLTSRISHESRVTFLGRQFDATFRLDLFYGIFAVALVAFDEILQQASATTAWITAAIALLAFVFIVWRSQARRRSREAPVAPTRPA